MTHHRELTEKLYHQLLTFKALSHEEIQLIESAFREVREDALKEAVDVCKNEHDRRVTLVKEGHKHSGVLLAEASGATLCALTISALIAKTQTRCKCICHEKHCPDCGSTLFGYDENGKVIL